MVYSDKVKLFWATGRRLFGNKFFEFYRGPRFKEVDRERNHLDPMASENNFIVPNRSTLDASDKKLTVPKHFEHSISIFNQ